jgi:hypothetical protein
MRQMKRWIGVDGDADALGPRVFGIGLGATTETKSETNFDLTRSRTMRKERKVV